MAASTCISCQERLFCADSALSITGNVIGILTFVGAAMISIQIYLSSMRNAKWDIHLMSRRLELRLAEVQHLQDLLDDNSGVICEMLSPGLQKANATLKDLEHRLLQIDRGSGEKRGRYLKSTRFVYAVDHLKKCIEEADEAMGITRGQVVRALLRSVASDTVLKICD